eukprot:UN20837
MRENIQEFTPCWEGQDCIVPQLPENRAQYMNPRNGSPPPVQQQPQGTISEPPRNQLTEIPAPQVENRP